LYGAHRVLNRAHLIQLCAAGDEALFSGAIVRLHDLVGMIGSLHWLLRLIVRCMSARHGERHGGFADNMIDLSRPPVCQAAS
jgi:hypothetical protein